MYVLIRSAGRPLTKCASSNRVNDSGSAKHRRSHGRKSPTVLKRLTRLTDGPPNRGRSRGDGLPARRCATSRRLPLLIFSTPQPFRVPFPCARLTVNVWSRSLRRRVAISSRQAVEFGGGLDAVDVHGRPFVASFCMNLWDRARDRHIQTAVDHVGTHLDSTGTIAERLIHGFPFAASSAIQSPGACATSCEPLMYRSVTAIVECPRLCWMSAIATPRRLACVASERRNA